MGGGGAYLYGTFDEPEFERYRDRIGKRVPKQLHPEMGRIYDNALKRIAHEYGIRFEKDKFDTRFQGDAEKMIYRVYKQGLYGKDKKGNIVINKKAENAIMEAATNLLESITYVDPAARILYDEVKEAKRNVGQFRLSGDRYGMRGSVEMSQIRKGVLSGLITRRATASTADAWIQEAQGMGYFMDVDASASEPDIVQQVADYVSRAHDAAYTRKTLFSRYDDGFKEAQMDTTFIIEDEIRKALKRTNRKK